MFFVLRTYFYATRVSFYQHPFSTMRWISYFVLSKSLLVYNLFLGKRGRFPFLDSSLLLAPSPLQSFHNLRQPFRNLDMLRTHLLALMAEGTFVAGVASEVTAEFALGGFEVAVQLIFVVNLEMCRNINVLRARLTIGASCAADGVKRCELLLHLLDCLVFSFRKHRDGRPDDLPNDV